MPRNVGLDGGFYNTFDPMAGLTYTLQVQVFGFNSFGDKTPVPIGVATFSFSFSNGVLNLIEPDKKTW